MPKLLLLEWNSIPMIQMGRKKIGKDLFVCQIYVYDIFFGSTNELFCEEFGKMMSK